MILLTVEELLLLQQRLLDKTGGLPGLRDRGLLESAVYGIEAGYDEVELYPAIEMKAARLAYAVTNNHAFVDGNKRLGIAAMLITLDLNGIRIHYSQQELIRLGLSIADGTAGYEAVLHWIEEHK